MDKDYTCQDYGTETEWTRIKVTVPLGQLDELVAAQKTMEIQEIVLAFNEIGKVLLSYTNADVDKGVEIAKVEELIAAFIETYGEDEYAAQCTTLNRDLTAETAASLLGGLGSLFKK